MNDITKEIEKLADDFGIDKKRSIGEIASAIGVEPHIIRFWEENFAQIKPEIGKGGRRYYYNKQLKILKRIKKFLYEDGYTIAGLQKLLKKRKPDVYKEEDINIILANDINDSIDLVKNSDFIEEKLDYSDSKTSTESLLLVAESNKNDREQLSSLFRNITKNLGDLKFLLRS